MMIKSYVIYGLAATLIVASWLGNIGYNRYYRLPEGRFLQHHIEAMDSLGIAFDLYYVANKGDKRTIQSIQAAGLPALAVYPVQVRQELNRQTIYAITCYYQSAAERTTAQPPLRLHAVTVTFNDGLTKEMEVGDIIVYRDRNPSLDSPVEFSSGGSSSDHSGYNSMRMTRPAALTATSSAWLGLLGKDFQFDVKRIINITDASGIHETEAAYPMKLAEGDSVITNYRFDFAGSDPLATHVFRLLLAHTFEEDGGRRLNDPIYASYEPVFTESQMKYFVRAQREERK
ncbi:hypothetical protein GXP70_14070 [Paenibacillus lycopersici]|uniref:Uncharacterized protein n=1 Tax=Paenibacillus lycopersici TaxID=2704462 RepID=A0A6C0FY15_9BACL|nr:hypothetical protein [Paenibacillus lycopersici]QHT60962.1 hypothetical protein GXP70_14070 [Paenibacillus lycopersici]